MENVEFEKNFVVFSNDQVEARYILTPSLMEKILKLKTTFKVTPNLAFHGSHVYVAISMKDMFEPALFGDVTGREQLQYFLTIVKQVAGIVEELDLNTRIWTKS